MKSFKWIDQNTLSDTYIYQLLQDIDRELTDISNDNKLEKDYYYNKYRNVEDYINNLSNISNAVYTPIKIHKDIIPDKGIIFTLEGVNSNIDTSELMSYLNNISDKINQRVQDYINKSISTGDVEDIEPIFLKIGDEFEKFILDNEVKYNRLTTGLLDEYQLPSLLPGVIHQPNPGYDYLYQNVPIDYKKNINYGHYTTLIIKAQNISSDPYFNTVYNYIQSLYIYIIQNNLDSINARDGFISILKRLCGLYAVYNKLYVSSGALLISCNNSNGKLYAVSPYEIILKCKNITFNSIDATKASFDHIIDNVMIEIMYSKK